MSPALEVDDDVQIDKQVTTETFGVPVVQFEVWSTGDRPVDVELLESVPASVGEADIQFLPVPGPGEWTVEGNLLRFEGVVEPGESLTGAYVVSASGATDDLGGDPVVTAEPHAPAPAEEPPAVDEAGADRSRESLTASGVFHSAYHSAFDDSTVDEELAEAFRELRSEYGPVARDELLPVLLAELSRAPEEATSFRELLGVETTQSMEDRLDTIQAHLSNLEAELGAVEADDESREATNRVVVEFVDTVDAMDEELRSVGSDLDEVREVRDDLVARVATLESALGETQTFERRISSLEAWHDQFVDILRGNDAPEDA